MKVKVILPIIIILSAAAYLGFTNIFKNNPQKLTTPQSKTTAKAKITPTFTPTPTPVRFNFDSSTNLQQELELVNPQVLNSDFEPLEKVIDSFK